MNKQIIALNTNTNYSCQHQRTLRPVPIPAFEKATLTKSCQNKTNFRLQEGKPINIYEEVGVLVLYQFYTRTIEYMFGSTSDTFSEIELSYVFLERLNIQF